MLSGLPMVIISNGSYHNSAVLSTFEDIDLNIIMHSSQMSTIHYMLRNDHAATIIYRDIFTNDPDICCIPLERTIPAHVHVFWQKNNYVSSAMKSFISYITRLEI